MTQAQPSKDKSILLVEDTESNASLFQMMLERMGYRCQITTTGQQALESLRDNTFDLVLLDMRLPDMNGVQVARTIREELGLTNAQLPIIALTAYVEPENITTYFEAGMDDFLEKPLKRAALEQMLDTWLFGGLGDLDPFVSGFDYTDVNPPDLDLEALQSFVGHMDKEKLGEMLGQFKKDCEYRIQTLHDKPDDAEMIQPVLHALIATSASMGLMKLSLYCRDIMDSSHRGEYVNPKKIAETLDSYYNASIGQLEDYIKSL